MGGQGEPRRQGKLQGGLVELGGLAGIGLGLGDGEVQQQFVALGVGVLGAVGEPQLEQGHAALALALTHLQAAQLGAGIGIARAGGQVGFHGLAQPGGLVACGQEFRAVAVVQQGGNGAVGDAPLGLLAEQGQHAVVHHRVVRAAPLDGRMAAKQPAHAGIGGLPGSLLQAQQIDQQQIRLGHQLLERLLGLLLQEFIGIEHQHPIPPHMLEGLIAGGGEIPWPDHLVHLSPPALGDGHGGVAGAGVEQHHLIDKAGHRSQAALQPFRFIANDHREAEPDRGHQLSHSTVAGARGLRKGSAASSERWNSFFRRRYHFAWVSAPSIRVRGGLWRSPSCCCSTTSRS